MAANILNANSPAHVPIVDFSSSATEIQSVMPLDYTFTNATTVRFSVQFSQAVQGVDAEDFALRVFDAISNARILNVAGAGSQYVVSVDAGDGDGLIFLSLAQDYVISGPNDDQPMSLTWPGGQGYVMAGTNGRHPIDKSPNDDNGFTLFDDPTSSISGFKFNDLNGNGLRDASEPGLAGWTIYLDSNANGTLDGTEPSVVTGADGSYTFSNLLPGKYLVGEVMQSGWEQTAPGAATFPIRRVSVTSTGVEGGGSSDRPSVSGDGRFVAFESASILTPGDTAISDIFVFDRITKTIEKISNGLNGAIANGNSFEPAISNDGRMVVYTSNATNLDSSDVDTQSDVYVYDRQNQTTRLISRSQTSNGSGASGPGVDISGDGRYVVFQSEASNLADNDTNNQSDIFVFDLQDPNPATRLQLISRGLNGSSTNGSSTRPKISDDGTQIVYESTASNLVPNDTLLSDIFVTSRASLITRRVSQTAAGETANSFSQAANISGDGRYVAFWTEASNLTAGDINGTRDVVLVDLSLNTVEAVSRTSAGELTGLSSARPAISTDGRYVAFGTTNSQLAVNGLDVVLLRDRLAGTTRQLSLSSVGTVGGGASYFFDLSSDGQTVVLSSDAKHLIDGDNNYARDVFAIDTSFVWVPNTRPVTLGSNQVLTNVLIGNQTVAVDLQGTAWRDNSRNGVRDAGEPVIADRRIYLDTNSNNQWDATETSQLTDANGMYRFANLAAGTYRVREVMPPNWTEYYPGTGHLVTAGSQRTVTLDFEGLQGPFIGVYEREGFVLSGTQTSASQWAVLSYSSSTNALNKALGAAADVPQYLTRRDGRAFNVTSLDMALQLPVSVTLLGIKQDGTQVTQTIAVSQDLVTYNLSGFTNLRSLHWSGSPRSNVVLDNFVIQTLDWDYSTLDFGSLPNFGEISGVVYLDTNHDGVRGANESVLGGRSVYLDSNNNGVRDTTETLVTTDTVTGIYRFSNLSPGNYIVRQQLPINWFQSEPAADAAQLVTITPGLFLSDVRFGTWPQAGTITGTKFEDRNFNGMRESGEPALAGWTIYLDTNNNGQLDAGESSTVTSSDDLGTTTIDETGRYAFTDLLPGSYAVREVPQTNWRQTGPLPMPSLSIERSTATGNSNPIFENNPTFDEQLNSTGRYLVFTTAIALVSSDTNGLGDVYLLDRQTDVFERISLSTTGGNANGNSFEPSVSDDGRYVAFRSLASNLTANGAGGVSNVYLRDRALGVTQMISMGATAAPNGSSWEPVLSGDGTTLAFYTSANNLGLPDSNGVSDLLIKNLTTGVLTRADASSATPALAITDTFGGDVSANGRYVAFQAVSAGTSQIYWLDRQTGQVQRASTSSVGSTGNLASEKRAISDDGRWVVFDSLATNLTEDTGFVAGAGGYNIFLKDMVTGQTRLVSRSVNGGAANASRRPDISGDGRWVVFESTSQTMFADSSGSTTQIVLYDRLTNTLKRLSETSSGQKASGVNVNASISADGSAVAFQSTSINIGPTAGGIFTIDRALDYTQPLAAIAPVTAGIVTGGIDFANEHMTASISGSAFEDVNRNGQRDAGEAVLSGVTVYLDQNKNGLLDAGELSQQTSATGAYSFNNLPGGSKLIRAVTPVDRILTIPQATTNRLFGTYTVGAQLAIAELNPQTGAVINSFVTTVSFNSAMGIAFDGTNILVLKPSAQELYKFSPSGQLLETVSLVSILGNTTFGSGLAYFDGLIYFVQNRDNWFSLVALDPRTNQLVRVMPITHSLDSYGGSSFPGFGLGLGEAPDGNGLMLTTTDAPADTRMLRLDPFSGRVTQYITPDAGLPADLGLTSFGGEMFVSVSGSIRVFNSTFNPVRSLTTTNTYTALGGGPWLDLGHPINLASGQVVTDRNFGLLSTKGTISGHLYEDRNANGQQDSGEANLVGTRVYIDANSNHRFDNDEPSVSTDSVGNYILREVPAGPAIIRIQPPTGFGVLAPINPENRLFAARFTDPVGSIVELNPYDGSVLQTLNVPNGTVFSGNVGLAYDGREVFFIEAQTRLLLGIDPDTGLLLRSVQMDSGNIDGLAYASGKLYMLDYVSDTILEFDLQTNQIVRSMDINALNPNFLGAGTRIELGVAMGEAADGSRLIVHSLTPLPVSYVVNRTTGVIEGQWSQAIASGLAGTATESYRAQPGATPSMSVVNSQGNILRRYNTAQTLRGLAAATPGSSQWRFNVNRGQVVSAADFTVRDNSVPIDILLSSTSLLENQPAGTVVGNLSAFDANASDNHTFALVAGSGDSDNALFQINGTQLLTSQSFDREQRNSYSVRLRAVDATGNAFEKAITINIANMPELSAAVLIGDGTAQRSRVDRLVVEIDGAVDIDSGAFQIHKRERDGQGTLVLQPVESAWTVDNLANGHARITLTFSGSYTRASGGLIDGNYQLTIDATKIRAAGTSIALDGNSDGTSGGNYLLGTEQVDSFYALYGDSDGGRSVGVADFGRFRSVFGKSLGDSGYDANFDFDNNNAVGVSDFGQFRSRFGKSLDF